MELTRFQQLQRKPGDASETALGACINHNGITGDRQNDVGKFYGQLSTIGKSSWHVVLWSIQARMDDPLPEEYQLLKIVAVNLKKEKSKRHKMDIRECLQIRKAAHLLVQ